VAHADELDARLGRAHQRHEPEGDGVARHTAARYAIDDEESHLGVICLGSAIVGYGDEPVAAMSGSGVKPAVEAIGIETVGTHVRASAARISSLLGAFQTLDQLGGAVVPSSFSERATTIACRSTSRSATFSASASEMRIPGADEGLGERAVDVAAGVEVPSDLVQAQVVALDGGS
jgi:hypothetical protein